MNDLEYRPFTSIAAKEPSLLNVEQRMKFHTSRNDHLILPEAWKYILHEGNSYKLKVYLGSSTLSTLAQTHHTSNA